MWTLPPLVIVQEVQICLFQRVPSSNAIQLVCAHGSVASCTCGTWRMCTFRSTPAVHCVIKTPTASLGCIHTLKASQLFGNSTRARGKHPFLFFRSSRLNVTLYLKMWNVHERYTCCTSCPREWLAFVEDKKTTKRAPTVPSKLLPILRPSVAS